VGAGEGTSAATRPRHTGHAIARRAIKGVHRIHIRRHLTPRHREGVVLPVVHERTDGVGQECLTRSGAKQGLQRFCVLACGVGPLVVGRRRGNDRHLVVNRSQPLVRFRGEARTGFDERAVRGLSLFPQGDQHIRWNALSGSHGG
jgi:hypothetical protein